MIDFAARKRSFSVLKSCSIRDGLTTQPNPSHPNPTQLNPAQYNLYVLSHQCSWKECLQGSSRAVSSASKSSLHTAHSCPSSALPFCDRQRGDNGGEKQKKKKQAQEHEYNHNQKTKTPDVNMSSIILNEPPKSEQKH